MSMIYTFINTRRIFSATSASFNERKADDKRSDLRYSDTCFMIVEVFKYLCGRVNHIVNIINNRHHLPTYKVCVLPSPNNSIHQINQ